MVSSTVFVLKRNDTAPSITMFLKDGNGVAVSLAGATAKFIMKLPNAGSAKVSSAVVIVDADTGEVRYDWLAADTDTSGTYLAEVEVTFGDGTVRTFPNNSYSKIQIKDDLG